MDSTVGHSYDKPGGAGRVGIKGYARYADSGAMQGQNMMTTSAEPASNLSHQPRSAADQLKLAAAAYLARFKGLIP